MANEEFRGTSEVTGLKNYRNNKASEPFRVVSVSSLTLSWFRLSLEEYENDARLVSLFNTIESRRGYSWKFLVGVCRLVLQILTPLQTKTCHFPHPFSDRACKIHIRFQTWPLRNYVIIYTEIKTRTNTIHLKIHFQFAYFTFFLAHVELRRLSFPLLVPSKTISRPKWAKSIPVFRPKQRRNDTLWSGTYLCGVCKEVPHWTLNSPEQWMGRCLEQGNHYDDFNSDINNNNNNNNNELYLHDLTIQGRTVLQ